MCCLLSIPIRDAYYLSRIANDDARNIISGDDRVYIVHDGKVFEYSQKNGSVVESDAQIVYPDYAELVKQKIDEVCVGAGYESNENHPFKTESFVYDRIKSLNLGDLLKNYDFDLKSIDLSAVFLFMEHVDPEVTNKLVKHVLKDVDPAAFNLHRPTLCTLALASMEDKASSEVENLKRTIFIADLVRQKVDELRAAATNKNVNTNSVDASTSQGNTSDVVVEEQKTENNNSAVTDESASQGNTSEEVANEPAKPEKPNRGGRK